MKTPRLFLYTLLMFSLLVLPGCSASEREGLETLATGTYDTSLTIGRSQVRDAVRDGALLANDQPLFTQIATDYGFDGDLFRVNGEYLDAGGQTREGSIGFELSAEDGVLRVTIVAHDLEGLDVDIAALEEGIARRMTDDLANAFSEPVVAVLDVDPDGANMVVVSLRVAADLDSNIVPMDRP